MVVFILSVALTSISLHSVTMGNLFSTPPTRVLYNDIKLLWPNPQKVFPRDFDPEQPFCSQVLAVVDRQAFIERLQTEDFAGLVRPENFNPAASSLTVELPRIVELSDGATFILVPPTRRILRQMVSSFAAFCYLL